MFTTIISVKNVQSFFDETSAPEKKLYHPESIPQLIYTFKETESKRFKVVYQPQQFQPFQPYQPFQFSQQMFIKSPLALFKKGKKGKKTKSMLFVGIYNEKKIMTMPFPFAKCFNNIK